MAFPYPTRAPDQERFAGDFEFLQPAPGTVVTAQQQALRQRVADVLNELADIVGEPDKLATLQLDRERKAVASRMLELVRQVDTGELSAEAALPLTYEAWGEFCARRQRIEAAVIVVSGLGANGRVVHGRQGFEDILYQFGEGTVSAEQISLKGGIDRALAVVREVVEPSNVARGRARSDYIRDLVGVAEMGLQHAQLALATQELAIFKQSFVLREAGALKNGYVRRLGFWSALLGLLALLVYMAIDWNWNGGGTPRMDRYGLFAHFGALLHRFQNLFLIAIGAAGGAWLAFLIRRPTLAFDDLTQLDEDLLRPGIRMVYTMLLSPLAGLLFWTGMVSVKLGGFDSNVAHSGLVCVVIGALTGIASRAVATAVGRRADDLAAAIGGGARPPA